MIINVTGQHLKMTEPIKQYAITKCSKVEVFGKHSTNGHSIISK